jgi:hypothetical protein
MAVKLKTLRLLLKEIDDKYVQENFYKLKLYLDDLEGQLTGSTVPGGASTIITPSPPVLQVPRVVETFTTDVATDVGDLVKISGVNTVMRLFSNTSVEIPHGIFGVGYNKISPTLIEVLFLGSLGGFSGLTPGQAIFVDTAGATTISPPATGMVQQIGHAISATEIFFQPRVAYRRS